MSYYRAPREESLFFRFPEELPIVLSGHPVRDIDLESRVAKALKSEFDINPSWKSYKEANEHERRWSWWRWPQLGWQTIQGFFAGVLSTCMAFSLSYAHSSS